MANPNILTLKEEFKRQTHQDADKNWPLYLAFVQAQALLTINANLAGLASSIKDIKDHLQVNPPGK